MGLFPLPGVPPTASSGAAAIRTARPLIVEVLAVDTIGAVRNSLAETALRTLQPGALIQGHVTEIGGAGLIRLSTPRGDIAIRPPADLPFEPGSAVSLRLMTVGDQPTAALLSIDGRTV